MPKAKHMQGIILKSELTLQIALPGTLDIRLLGNFLGRLKTETRTSGFLATHSYPIVNTGIGKVSIVYSFCAIHNSFRVSLSVRGEFMLATHPINCKLMLSEVHIYSCICINPSLR